MLDLSDSVIQCNKKQELRGPFHTAVFSAFSKEDHDRRRRTISNDRAGLESSRPNTKERVLLLCVPTRVFTAAMPTSPMNDGCTTHT